MIAIERFDRRVVAFVATTISRGGRFFIPAGALAQAWRGGPRQAALAAFLKRSDVTIEAMDARVARAAGELCAHSEKHDVVDASVVLSARAHNAVVVTSDADDIRAMDAGLALVAL